MSSIISSILWYLTLVIVGWLSYPMTHRLFKGLPDRGYSFSRILGLLLWGYIFWLLTSLGVMRNEWASILAAAILLGIISLWLAGMIANKGFWRNNWTEFKESCKDRRRYILSIELICAAAFTVMLVIRAANPEILGTEKPMELAFINAILRSPTFPPHDPWLSGYAISYYYFGFVLVGTLAKFSGALGSVAFNLGIGTVFSLSVIGSCGLLYNLLPRPKLRLAMLAPLFLLLLSNLGGLLEVMHAGGVFWQTDDTGALSSSFWKWLDIKNLDEPPQFPYDGLPKRYYWWWQSSRVIQDYNLADTPLEIIDEFPAFSFLLSDSHPHVLAMPFAFLMMGLALNLFLGGCAGSTRLGKIHYPIDPVSLIMSGLLLGSMAFLNTWDFPVYVALFLGAYCLWRVNQSGWGWGRLRECFDLGIITLLGGILFYLPFYLGFSSQAGGLLPNVVYPTRGAHLWVMFGLLFIPIGCWIAYQLLQEKNERRLDLRPAWAVAGLFAAGWILALVYAWLITRLPNFGRMFFDLLAAGDVSEMLQAAVMRRLENAGGWLTLLTFNCGIAVLIVALMRKPGQNPPQSGSSAGRPGEGSVPQTNLFVALLFLLGSVLVTFPEFFYLRDQFGWRINTIFKFYFQAWLLWAIVASYATIMLGRSSRWFGFLSSGLIVIGLIYITLGLFTKTNGFNPDGGFTLDGAAFMERQNPDEMAGIRWLQHAPYGVVVEAVGGSYTQYARAATFSGLPGVLGWPGHESQWRGGSLEMGSREEDIETIFRSTRWEDVKYLLDQYDIRYVFTGGLERSKYDARETLFKRYLRPVFQQGSVTIYEVSR